MLLPENQKIRVLLIEDSRSEAAFTQHSVMMEDDGRIDFTIAHDLAGGMKYLGEAHADAIILDLHLPDSDGLGSINRLTTFYPDMPIIVLSGRQDEVAILQYLKLGVQEFLLKGSVNGQMIRLAIFSAMFRHSLKKNLDKTKR